MDRIAIGICVKNSERTVRRTIDSILGQRYPRRLMELIVVDGLSRDRTLATVKDMLSKSNLCVRIYSDQGMGLGYARQIVALSATSKYVAFVDGDVELFSDFVQSQVEFMERNPEVGVAMGKYMCRIGGLVPTLESLSHHISYEEFLGNDATIYRLEALKQAGGFDTNIKGAAEDLDLMYRIRNLGYSFCVNPKAGFYHNSRRSLGSLWVEYAWYGYGDHYISHKHRTLRPLWVNNPLVALLSVLKLVDKAYRQTRLKVSFLILLLMVVHKVAWWSGFVRAHIKGYGHKRVTTKPD